jgi:hypothetical protein
MSNVVRLVNGGSIQVRTGVMQGIGPRGATGPAGPQGPQGDQGSIGETGPMGQILQSMARASVASTFPVAANTDTTAVWGAVAYDDLSTFISSSNVVLTVPGDYCISAWVRFDDAVAGLREIWFTSGGATVARSSRTSQVGQPFFVDIAHPYRAAGGDTVNVWVRSTQATNVGQGAITVNRIGSGPQGPIGPVGPIGPPGIQGLQGVAGPGGNAATSGFTTYTQLLPH